MREKHDTTPHKQERHRKREAQDESPLVLQEVAGARPRWCQRKTVLVIPALPKRGMPRGLRVKFSGGDGGRLATVRLGETVCSILDELEDAVGVPLDESPMQGSKALLVGGLDVCAPSEEDVDTLVEALVGSPHQGSVAVGVEDVDRDALVEEQDNEEDVAAKCRRMEGVVALGVGDEGIGAMLEE